MAQKYWFVNAMRDGQLVNWSTFLTSYEAAAASLKSARENAKSFDWRIMRLVDPVSAGSIKTAPGADAPDSRLNMLAKAIDLAIDRIEKLEKLTDDHSTRETFSYAIAVDTALRRLIGLLEEKVDKQRKTDDEWARMISDRVRKLEMRKPEAAPSPETKDWEEYNAPENQPRTWRMVRAAFDEEWAPNIRTMPSWVEWVGIDRSGVMRGYGRKPTCTGRDWWALPSVGNDVVELGYVNLADFNHADWHDSLRKVVR